MKTLTNLLIVFLLTFALVAHLVADAPTSSSLEVRGRWLFDAAGKPIPPVDFRRGLQPSGLAFARGELWCVGDQRGQYPGHLLRIDPKTSRLIGKPLRLELPAKTAGENPEYEAYRSIPRSNPDFEGLAAVSGDGSRFLALTEDKAAWIADVRVEGAGDGMRARIAELTRVVYPEALAPWNNNPNYGFEGLAISDDGQTVYLAFERAKDNLPRIYKLPFAAAVAGKPAAIEALPIPFAGLPARADKEKSLLNLNDVQFLRHQGRAALACVLRDQERLLLIDLENNACTRLVELELRDPAGGAVFWVSPEGLAIDPATKTLWLVNDPDSERSNYKGRDAKAPEGEFANYTPLVFELALSKLLGDS